MTLPPRVSSAAGVRTEQDLYARLIDSVTKQVGQLSSRRPSHHSLGQQPVTPLFLPRSQYLTRDRTRIPRCAECCSRTKSCAGE